VTKASTFEEARAHLENQVFDIAILDIMGVNGYELLELAIKKNVIAPMVTAHALSPEHTVTSFRKGPRFSFPRKRWATWRSSSMMFWRRKKKGIAFGARLDGYYRKASGFVIIRLLLRLITNNLTS